MKKTTNSCLLAVVIAGVAFTGAFAQGPVKSPGRPGVRVEETVTAPGGPGGPRDIARDQAARKERDKAVREFQNAVRAAERKFNADQKAAYGLQGEERSAAMQKGAEEMKASIKNAEDTKDATLEKLGQGRKKPSRHKERVKKDIDAGRISVEQKPAGQAEEQLKDNTKSPQAQQKN